MGRTLPYNHGRRCTRSGTVLWLKDCVEEVGSRNEAAFGRVAGLKGVGDGEEIMRFDHVGLEGAEENIEGQLGKAALALGSKDGVRLYRIGSVSRSAVRLAFSVVVPFLIQ